MGRSGTDQSLIQYDEPHSITITPPQAMMYNS